MDPLIEKKRTEIVHSLASAKEKIARAQTGIDISLSPLIGRLESGGISGIGPKLTGSIPLPGDGELRNTVRYERLEILDQEQRDREGLTNKDFNKSFENQIRASTLTELLTIVNEVDDKKRLDSLRARIEYSKEGAKEKAEIYRSKSDLVPISESTLSALNQFEGEFVGTISSVGAKTRSWWKKIIPSRLNLGVEPLSIGRSVTPLGVAGLEFYKGPKGRLSDQLLELKRSSLTLRGEYDAGVKETYLALVDIRDNPKRVVELKSLLKSITDQGEASWEIVKELEVVLSQVETAKLKVRSWIGIIPELRQSSDDDLLKIANTLVWKGIKERIPHIDDLKEELQGKVKRLKGEDRKLGDEALSEIEKLGVINTELGVARKNFIEGARITPTYSPKVKVSSEVQVGYQAEGAVSELPGFYVLDKKILTPMAVVSVALPRKGKRELYAEYYKIRKEVNGLRAESLRIDDEVKANTVISELNAAETAMKNNSTDVEGVLAKLKGERIYLQKKQEQRFLNSSPEAVSDLAVIKPEYYKALYRQAELEHELLRRGYKDIVLSSMTQNDGRTSHQFLSLDLSTFTEKPIRSFFRKLFRRGERPEVIAAKKNLEIVALEASEEFLEVEMARERSLRSVLTRSKTLPSHPEDNRERRSKNAEGDRLNIEYHRWEEFINNSRKDPNYEKKLRTPEENLLTTKLGEAFDKELGREEPIAKNKLSVQRAILGEFYSKKLEEVDLINGLFVSNTVPKQPMSRYGATLSFSYNSQGSIWNRSDLLREIEEVDRSQIEEHIKFYQRKQEAVIRAENKLGAAKVIGQLVEELSGGTQSEELVKRIKRVKGLLEINAEDSLREVGLTTSRIRNELKKNEKGEVVDVIDIEAQPRPVDYPVFIPIDLTKDKINLLAQRLNPGLGQEALAGRWQLNGQSGAAFIGNKSFGGVSSLGSFSLLENGERKGRNQRAEKLEELQENERQLSISRRYKEIEFSEKKVMDGMKTLSALSKEYWRIKDIFHNGANPSDKNINVFIDSVIQYYSLREEVETESFNLYLLSSFSKVGEEAKFNWKN